MARRLLYRWYVRSRLPHPVHLHVASLAALSLGACVIPANIEQQSNATNRPPEIISGDPDFLNLPYVAAGSALTAGFAFTITARDYDGDDLSAKLFRLQGGVQEPQSAALPLADVMGGGGIDQTGSFAQLRYCNIWGPGTWYVTVAVTDRPFPTSNKPDDLPPKENSAYRTWVIVCTAG